VPTMTAAETLTFYAALTQNASRRAVPCKATGSPAVAADRAAEAGGEAAAAAAARCACVAGSGVIHTTVHVWTSDRGSNSDTGSSSDGSTTHRDTAPDKAAAGQVQARVAEVLGLVGLTQQASTLVSPQCGGWWG
jgi:hypothetical protein